ncbi:MAG TPA: PRC-barrel domain-containing protein [Nitrososphaera sp.]|nr:PRC-barrel domain-containing protein [Nitrososphaera sp.]
MSDHDPFSDWSELINRPVYAVDGKKVGFLRSIIADYLLVNKGFIVLNKYYIPKTLAESVDRKGRIRLRITTFEVRANYTYSKMKDVLTATGYIPEWKVKQSSSYDRLQTLRYSATRNRLAACIAFVSAILFLASGYKANIEIYNLVASEVLSIQSLRQFWNLVIVPIGFLAILSQLGGITVMMGAGFFAANRVNFGKILVMIGTGQGLFTIAIRMLVELWSGQLWSLNNYVIWLTSTATGLGILFAVVAPTIAKGKGDSIISKTIRLILRRR